MTKSQKARAAIKRVRDKARESRAMQFVSVPAACYLFGLAESEGVKLPSVKKVGPHATVGLLAAGAYFTMKGTGFVQDAAAAVGVAGLGLAAYQAGKSGTIGYEEIR